MLQLSDCFQAPGSLGLEAADSCAWGVWDNYAVSVRQSQGVFYLYAAVRIDAGDKVLKKAVPDSGPEPPFYFFRQKRRKQGYRRQRKTR